MLSLLISKYLVSYLLCSPLVTHVSLFSMHFFVQEVFPAVSFSLRSSQILTAELGMEEDELKPETNISNRKWLVRESRDQDISFPNGLLYHSLMLFIVHCLHTLQVKVFIKLPSVCVSSAFGGPLCHSMC